LSTYDFSLPSSSLEFLSLETDLVLFSHLQTRQTVRSTVAADPSGATKAVVEKKRSIWQTILDILRQNGLQGFFHGLGPALILVSNPILQFTVRLAFSSPLVSHSPA
jgi:hypothetical protein